MCRRSWFWVFLGVMTMFLPSGDPVRVFWFDEEQEVTCEVPDHAR